MCFDQCPAEYRDRYVDGLALELTEALAFGSAMHLGLEAHFQGHDAELAFRRAWKSYQPALGPTTPGLTGTGLVLLEKVAELGLHGVPERGFSLDTEADLGAPIVGALDLYDAEAGVVYDFKTTRGAWSEARAETEVWQPMLYTQAIWEETGQLPEFEYIVLNRVTAKLSRFRRSWTPETWLEQMNRAWERMREVSVAVASGHLECHGEHGFCGECGGRWDHDHKCDPEISSRRIRL